MIYHILLYICLSNTKIKFYILFRVMWGLFENNPQGWGYEPQLCCTRVLISYLLAILFSRIVYLMFV